MQDYYIIRDGQRFGPFTADRLPYEGLTPDSYVWRPGLADWQPASTLPELSSYLYPHNQQQEESAFGTYAEMPPSHTPPHYNYGQPGQGYKQPYNNGYPQPNGGYPQPNGGYPQHYNWMTWAIIGTILGGLFSCIGLIFGIIGITKASSANRAYAMGDTLQGDQFNSTAKTMTIISLVLAGIGIIATGVLWGTSLGTIFAAID